MDTYKKIFKIILNLNYNVIFSQFQPKRVLSLVFLLATLCRGHYDWLLGVKNMHIIYRGAPDEKSIYRGALTQKSLRTPDLESVSLEEWCGWVLEGGSGQVT